MKRERPKFTAPLTCDACGADLPDLTRSTEWLMGQLSEIHEERDRYRGWFEKLLPIAWRGDPEARAEAERLQAAYDRMVNARTRANERRGEETRRKVLAAKKAGRSIAQTAMDLDLSPSWVATIRGTH